MSYKRVNWSDYPNTDTPIMADLLNTMDEQIEQNASDIEGIKSGTVEVGRAKKFGKDSVGSSNEPIYINKGVPNTCSIADEVKNVQGLVSNAAIYKALKNGFAAKLGVADVGSAKKPMYLKKGVPTASDATIGSKTVPVFLKAGTLTACEFDIPKAQSINIVDEALTGNITMPTTEIKKTVTLKSSRTFDKSKFFVTGVSAIKFGNTHHEFYCSDYDAYIGTDGKLCIDITVPTHTEIKGATSSITARVAMMTTEPMITTY